MIARFEAQIQESTTKLKKKINTNL